MSVPLKILIVEDSEDDTTLLIRRLRNSGYQPDYYRVDTADSFVHALEQEKWDIILADFYLPQFDALKALQLLSEKGMDLPFIIVSGAIGEETAVTAMKAGAHDYIMKDNLARLAPAIEREIKDAETRLQRKKADERIKRQLLEKEILIREIHHRVKNNLQIILSLIKLQTKNIKDDHVSELFQDIHARIRSMVLVHELLFQSESLATIPLSFYLKKLLSELFQGYRIDPARISYTINESAIYLDVDTAIYCGLIVNELVSNSLKHAFPSNGPDKGLIAVEVAQQEDQIEIVVQDNGIGFQGGLPTQKSPTLGLRLVRLLVEDQLGGSILSVTEQGACFTIRFQIKSENQAG